MQSPEDNLHNGEISAEEFDRLSLLLRPPTERTPEDSSPMDTSPSPFTGEYLLPLSSSPACPANDRRIHWPGTLGRLTLSNRAGGKGLSSACPAAELGEALHTHVPIFKDSMDASAVHLSTLAEWLADSIFDEQEPAG